MTFVPVASGALLATGGDNHVNAAQAGHLIANQCQGSNVGEMGTLRAGNGGVTGGVPFLPQHTGTVTCTWAKGPGNTQVDEGHIVPSLEGGSLAVRRLTPRECERLMGWPDDWTHYADDGTEIADSHRYRMCGNGVVANVAEWIGHRIMEVDK